ncbi:hypothetical protein CFC21_063274 [Triticum aestivum]|uniref:Bifunctional inhibitor/plant lipid transfer protein/seed storage helical domain-containing protein n=2 Tax=Triticum aestivum TaxID=4565 RepID=A0A9R1KJ63_WHEAT|nr:alpha-amylase/trypsin inhibitor CM16-like [Triticum aestivum]KAF7055795.1 hypothetical protein CFC21_063274 [Triticum aestivum]
MASKSNYNLLFAALLVFIFAAVAAVGNEDCTPWTSTLITPLPSCRNYVEEQACRIEMPGPPYLAKQECCEQLANIPQQCRCQALRYFMGPKSRPDQSGLMELPGCPREVQMNFVPILVTPGYCNLTTVHNTPYCLGMEESQWS